MPKLRHPAVAFSAAATVAAILAGAGLASAPRSASANICTFECGGTPTPVLVLGTILADKVPPKAIPPKDETVTENLSLVFSKIEFK